ncbi:hypothetical protein GWK47_008946 [Chionoecetes opilio]|uniref:Uncharacterized protein n=1 Tax=Chionoecetes opilio TaxID=41210 RepID=A0A8J4XZ20_CHIOP|nr:hypothetical protein GWK47_008946 [Chionoecetes opilio]
MARKGEQHCDAIGCSMLGTKLTDQSDVSLELAGQLPRPAILELSALPVTKHLGEGSFASRGSRHAVRGRDAIMKNHDGGDGPAGPPVGGLVARSWKRGGRALPPRPEHRSTSLKSSLTNAACPSTPLPRLVQRGHVPATWWRRSERLDRFHLKVLSTMTSSRTNILCERHLLHCLASPSRLGEQDFASSGRRSCGKESPLQPSSDVFRSGVSSCSVVHRLRTPLAHNPLLTPLVPALHRGSSPRRGPVPAPGGVSEGAGAVLACSRMTQAQDVIYLLAEKNKEILFAEDESLPPLTPAPRAPQEPVPVSSVLSRSIIPSLLPTSLQSCPGGSFFPTFSPNHGQFSSYPRYSSKSSPLAVSFTYFSPIITEFASYLLSNHPQFHSSYFSPIIPSFFLLLSNHPQFLPTSLQSSPVSSYFSPIIPSWQFLPTSRAQSSRTHFHSYGG